MANFLTGPKFRAEYRAKVALFYNHQCGCSKKSEKAAKIYISLTKAGSTLLYGPIRGHISGPVSATQPNAGQPSFLPCAQGANAAHTRAHPPHSSTPLVARALAPAQQPCHVGPVALLHPISAHFRALVGPGCSLSRPKSQVLAQSKIATCPAHSKLTNPLAPRGQSNPISFRR